MPNWCDNHAKLTTTEANIQKIVKAEGDGLLSLFVPLPKALADTREGNYGKGTPEQAELEKQVEHNLATYGYRHGYDWSIDNWGTKWDVPFDELNSNSFLLDGDNSTIHLYFASAWGPPDQFYRKLVDLGFTVEACYFESGNGFAGVFEGNPKEGVTTDVSFDYDIGSQGVAKPLDPKFNDEMQKVRNYLAIDDEEYDEDEEEEEPTPVHSNPLIAQLHREGLGHIADSVEEI